VYLLHDVRNAPSQPLLYFWDVLLCHSVVYVLRDVSTLIVILYLSWSPSVGHVRSRTVPYSALAMRSVACRHRHCRGPCKARVKCRTKRMEYRRLLGRSRPFSARVIGCSGRHLSTLTFLICNQHHTSKLASSQLAPFTLLGNGRPISPGQ
jgi:hypothetical protein